MTDFAHIEKQLRARVPLGASAELEVPLSGDHFGPQDKNAPGADVGDLRSAAVLIPIVDRQDGMTVLFTQRTEHLRSHAGQISFPGGARDPVDQNSIDTALRELFEETGIARNHVTILGRLQPYQTVTDYRVIPIAGIVQPEFTLNIDANEVESVFEAPLSFLLDPVNLVREQRMFRGRLRSYYAIPFGEHYIWGATAAILVNLAAVLRDYAAVSRKRGATG